MEFRTINEMFQKRAELSRGRRAYLVHRSGRWVDVTWDEMAREVEEVAAGLLSLGLEKGQAVSVLGETRPEWGISDLAVLAAGGRTVGIYHSNTVEQCIHVLSDSQSRFAFVEQAYFDKVLEAKSGCPALERIIVWGDAPQNGGTLSYQGLRELGRNQLTSNQGALEERRDGVEPGDEAILIYTSGTTGMPKGAVLTHKNLCSILRVLDRMATIGPDDITLAFLPMAHGAERVVGFYNRVAQGVPNAYARSLQTVIEDVKEIRPTIFGSVPRIFEKVYAKIQADIQRSPKPQRMLARWAIGVGLEVSRRQRRREKIPLVLQLQHRIADRLVLSKVRDAFGGRIRFFVSGAAPIAVEILEFFHACGMVVLEAYGLTESTVLISVNKLEDFRFGTVGKTLPGVQVRIATDGEILAKGDNIFKGYHNLPEATREAIDDEGWLHTGDIGEFDRDGFLKITDRKKNLIVTAGGKNITPANIEALIKADQVVGHVMAIGDRRPYIVALISLEPETAVKFAEENGLPSDLENLSQHPVLRERLQRSVDQANQKLARYEQVKKFAVLPVELTQESGELTPTLKVKRKIVEQKYNSEIEALYGSAETARTGAR